jgi:hypothetical protein
VDTATLDARGVRRTHVDSLEPRARHDLRVPAPAFGAHGERRALLALLILLVVVTLWAAHDRMWRLVWLGHRAPRLHLIRQTRLTNVSEFR